MLQVPMTSSDSVGAAALIYLIFAICHMFSRRRNSQNRRVKNAPYIESFMVISYTAVKKLSTARFEGYTVVTIVLSSFKGV